MNFTQEHINKFNQLFVLTRRKYIYQPSDTKSWITFDHDKNGKYPKFNDSMIKRHLNGKGTYGVFSAKSFTKFLTFDVDVKGDMDRAKWITMKLVYSLQQAGIDDKDIHISLSGNKGYHVDLYFNEPISNDIAYDFYELMISHSECTHTEIEFRPFMLKYGVKLPLGIHQGTGKRCWYVDKDNYYKPIKSFDYILKIEQMNVDAIYNILERARDIYDEQEIVEVEETRQLLERQVTPLNSYKQNVDEKETIEAIEKLLYEGIQMVGTRHNSSFKIAKYFRYQGFEQEETLDMLNEWIKQQDETKYTTPLEACYKDNELIVDYIYEKEVSMTFQSKKLEVSYEEMKQILKLKTLNQKIIAYCLLIHSKRFANQQGVFYMSFNQMCVASGLSDKTVRTIVNTLEESGILSIVARNQIIKDSKGAFVGKKPNKYKLNIEEVETSSVFELEVDELNYKESLKLVVNSFFNLKEIRNALPRRQYQKLRAN
ncbi:hypothetical protein ABZ756_03840 [Mammaliicoccus sciuri]